jgi:membrane protease YdiL (CAAX protease family)
MFAPGSQRFRPWTWLGAWLDFLVVTTCATAATWIVFTVCGIVFWTALNRHFSFEDAKSVWDSTGYVCFQFFEVAFLWGYAAWRGYSHIELWSRWSGVPVFVWSAIVIATIPYAEAQAWFLDTYFPEQAAADAQAWSSGFTLAAAPLLSLAVVAGAPLGEELIFRRLLIESARPGDVMLVLASVLSSAAWAGMHLYSWPSTFILFCEGLFLCWLALKVRSIWPGILAHMLFNLSAMWALVSQAAQQST